MSQPFLVERSAGYFEYQLPISLKAVIVWHGKIPLLRNERDEWELPGGKLELGEDPRLALKREVQEELAWDATVFDPFHAWVYKIKPDRHVFVLTYLATYDGEEPPQYSNEHKELGLFTLEDAVSPETPMPEDYKEAIQLVASGRVRPSS